MGRVLVVDDEPLFRLAVERWLERCGHAVFSATTVIDAEKTLRDDPPVDVVLLDINLPDGSAEDVLRMIEGVDVPPRVALISGMVNGDLWARLQKRCAVILPKPVSLPAIESVVRDLVEVNQEASRDLLDDFCAHYGLSPREAELLQLAIVGRSDKELPDLLGCARGTISTYWQRIFRKTGVHSQRDVLAAIVRHAAGPREPRPEVDGQPPPHPAPPAHEE